MNKLEAKKMINLIKKSAFRDVALKDFCDEMIVLINTGDYEPLTFNKGKRMILLRVNHLSLGLFSDNTLGMRESDGAFDLTMIPTYLFNEIDGLFGE